MGEKEKESKLLINPFSHGGNTLIDSGKEFSTKNKQENVNITTLDNFVKENNINQIDVIKVDIEGYELKFLQGAKETIKRFKPKIIISAYHCPYDKKKIPKSILEIRKDYKFKLIKSTEEDFIFW